eukprot:m.221723 g.221723  ORF g.221723 m.221723 type:complete len:94 (-) comp15870_c0_seq1:198-479(-)
MAAIQLYVSSVTSSTAMKKQIQKMEMVLDSHKVAYDSVDISLVEGSKEKMRELIGDANAIPPQLFNGDTYCGNYEQFMEANELGTVKEFLKLV